MPNPKTADEWFLLGDQHFDEARYSLAGPSSHRSLSRSASQAAESYLKGLLCKSHPNLDLREYRHNLLSLLNCVVKTYPDMASAREDIELLSSVSYGSSDDGEPLSCSTSAEAYYEPDLKVDDNEARAHVRAAETVAKMAHRALGRDSDACYE